MERERLRLRMLSADPMDMEAQRLIAQEIENKNIEQNMELAMEYNPESFGTVVMLYIDCKVNGHHIKAFVDSGAQATIMSQVRIYEYINLNINVVKVFFLQIIMCCKKVEKKKDRCVPIIVPFLSAKI